jgi:hypothetical protein
LNGAGSSSAQRGAGVAAQVVIQGSVPADLAAPVGAAAARANIPTARHVDDKSRRRRSLDVQNRLMEVMAFHPLGTIFIGYLEVTAVYAEAIRIFFGWSRRFE